MEKSIPFENSIAPAGAVTSRENMLRLFRGETPAWLDWDVNQILPRIVPDNVARGIVRDALPFDADTQAGGPDWLGIRWIYEPQNRGSFVAPGSPRVTDILCWEERVSLPDLDAPDWAASAAENAPLRDPARLTGTTIFTGFFERLISLMDFENAAIALVDEEEQEGVHRLFEALADFYDRLIGKFKEYYDIDVLEFHDDWGTQRAPLFSRAVCEEMLLPYLTRVVESCHRRGILFRMHSCGFIEPLVPVLIAAGADCWGGQPLNDKWKLYEQYGDRMRFTVTYESMEGVTDEARLAAFADAELARLIPGRNIFLQARNRRLRELLIEKSRAYFAGQA